MTFPVKWYSSKMEGAPLLSSGVAGSAHTTNPGSLIALLKAVLVTGFGIKSVSSLVYSSAAQTITATVAAGHKYLADQIVEISGANESGFNGEFRVLSTTSTTVVMGLDNGTPAAASATGTLSMNIPSLGWGVEFEDAVNYKIIFKRTDPLSTPIRLFVDNSAYTGWNTNSGFLAKVAMIEGPTDITTFSTVYQHYWPCSHSYALPEWQIVGDSRLFYFMPTFANSKARGVYYFGDINTITPGDNYHCLLGTHYTSAEGSASYWNTAGYAPYTNFAVFADTNHKWFARAYHQQLGNVSAYWRGLNPYMGEGVPFPNPADNGFYVSTEPVPVFDSLALRGFLPGVIVPYSSMASYDAVNISNMPSLPNSKIRFLMVAKNASTTASSLTSRMIGFDIKGPWR